MNLHKNFLANLATKLLTHSVKGSCSASFRHQTGHLTYLLGVRVDAGHEVLRHPDVAVVDLARAAAAGEDVLWREIQNP